MKLTHLLSFSFILFCTSFAQITYVPLQNDVYNFLERLSQRGVISYDDLFKPLSRKYIAEKLNEAKAKINMLTSLEKEELDFFESDYLFENNMNEEKDSIEISSGFFNKDNAGRFRLFHYDNDILKLNVSPILGYEAGFQKKELGKHLWNGLYLYGYLPAKIGFSFDFRDNNESGSLADPYKTFTPTTGIIPNINKKSFDYSEVKSSISIDWDWGNFVVAKEFMEYGYAKSGNIVLSNKAPSFPFILLQIKPADWINFIYFHALALFKCYRFSPGC